MPGTDITKASTLQNSKHTSTGRALGLNSTRAATVKRTAPRYSPRRPQREYLHKSRRKNSRDPSPLASSLFFSPARALTQNPPRRCIGPRHPQQRRATSRCGNRNRNRYSTLHPHKPNTAKVPPRRPPQQPPQDTMPTAREIETAFSLIVRAVRQTARWTSSKLKGDVLPWSYN